MIFRRNALFALVIAGLTEVYAAEVDRNTAVPSPNSGSTNAEIVALYKRMSLEELMAQDVTSVSKAPEPYRQAPAALVVLNQDTIRRSGASSLPEALRLADNLQVAQASSSTWQISARGFNSTVANKLLVLQDGRSLYTPLFSGVIWNMQDYLLEDLDRIEVISGPGGTLWGANAVNGVINIVSKDAKDTQGVYAEAGGGTWLEDFVGVRYGGMLATNVYYRIYGKYFDRGAELFRDGSSADDSWNRGQGGFRIDAQPTDQNHFTLQGDGFGGDNEVVPGGQGSPHETGYSRGANVLTRWTHTFSDEADMSLQLYYDRVHLEAPFQSAGTIPAGTLRDTLDTYDVDFQNRFGLGERQRIVWGLGYRFTHDAADAAPLVAFLPGTLERNLFSGFIQDEIKLHDRLYLTLGNKLEYFDYTGLEYEPSVRAHWNVTDRQMIWGAISRAVRTPARYDRDLFQPSPAYGELLVGNNSFESETVIAYELGYRAQLRTNLSGSLSTFYNEYDKLRSLTLTDGGLPLRFQNNLAGHTYGIELGMDYQALAWWRLHFGYNLLKEHIIVEPGGDIANGHGETADPQQQVFVRSSMDLPWDLEFDAAFRWIDQVHNNAGSTVGTIPSYAELDLRLAWRPTKQWELSLVGQNLLHDQHPEAGFPGPAQEEITRSVYGKVTWRF
ncbi:MAG: TonB-dependent receptor plug domain-containing protein [Verrucomicrobiota bacterium]